MRLRLFERVRRLAHPRAGKFGPRRGRAVETTRHDRPWEARSRGHAGDPHGQAVSASSADTAGRHRRHSQEAAGHAPAEVPAPTSEPPRAAEGRPPWADSHGSGPAPAGPPGDARSPAPRPPRPVNPPPRGRGKMAGRPADPPGVPMGGARARVRPYGTAPVVPPPASPATRDRNRAGPPTAARPQWLETERANLPAQRQADAVARAAGGAGSIRPRLPFAHPRNPGEPSCGDGRRNCGTLEAVLWRQWDPATLPPAEAATAIDRLAELPQQIKDKLAASLDGIFVGPGGVPQLDGMTALRGVPLPSGRATWDACAGAYGERKIVVGTQPSPTPDVMCHEVGHALDDIDAPAGRWQSDSAEFRMLYDQCQPHLAGDFHRQRGGLGRKEFFADAFAAIASRQRPALVDMLGGNTRTALNVMLYFNRRYGI